MLAAAHATPCDRRLVYSYARATRTVAEGYERPHAANIRALTPRTTEAIFVAQSAQRLRGISGDDRHDALWQAIDLMAAKGTEFVMPPFHYRIITTFARTMTPRMYGADFQEAMPRLMKRYHMRDEDAFRQQVFVEMPRRWGKTVVVAIFVSCYLRTQPTAAVNIYSTSMRISKEMAGLVVKFYTRLCELQGAQVEYAGTNNVEIKEFRNMWGGKSVLKTFAEGGDVRNPFLYREEGNQKSDGMLSISCSFLRKASWNSCCSDRLAFRMSSMMPRSDRRFLANCSDNALCRCTSLSRAMLARISARSSWFFCRSHSMALPRGPS
ncbi:MAG TPA: hypothetical protein VKD22_03940, partial [Ramlibacter sp.]|nr:hypothetical protein [Ramlibacter sp.]